MNRNTGFFGLLLLIGVFLFPALVVDNPFVAPSVGNKFFSMAQADDKSSERDKEGETVEASKKAGKKLTGFTERITDTWERISGWVSEKFKIFKGKVDAVFGFEKGEGPQAFFGSVFYFIILMALLFILAFIYNIIRDIFVGMSAKNKHKGPVRKKR